MSSGGTTARRNTRERQVFTHTRLRSYHVTDTSQWELCVIPAGPGAAVVLRQRRVMFLTSSRVFARR